MLEPLYAPLRERLLRNAAAVVTSSPALAKAPELRAHRSKVRVVPYGISPRLISGKPLRTRHDGTNLLFVGRLVYYKGVEFLLQATAITPDVRLTIVGEGPERGRLEEMTHLLGIANRVSFVGLIDDVALMAQYSTADVFVLPSVSRAEAFGMAMSEAMANGLPAISTALGTGTDWVNIDGVTGLVVAPRDAAALAGAIGMMNNISYRHRLADAAYHRAQAELSFEHHISLIEGIYEAVACPALVVGTGFIGDYLAETLRASGIEVTQSSRAEGPATLAVADGSALDSVLSDGNFDQIVVVGQLTGIGMDWVLQRIDGPRWLVMSSHQLQSIIKGPDYGIALERETRALARGACVLRPTMALRSRSRSECFSHHPSHTSLPHRGPPRARRAGGAAHPRSGPCRTCAVARQRTPRRSPRGGRARSCTATRACLDNRSGPRSTIRRAPGSGDLPPRCQPHCTADTSPARSTPSPHRDKNNTDQRDNGGVPVVAGAPGDPTGASLLGGRVCANRSIGLQIGAASVEVISFGFGVREGMTCGFWSTGPTSSPTVLEMLRPRRNPQLLTLPPTSGFAPHGDLLSASRRRHRLTRQRSRMAGPNVGLSTSPVSST